MAPPGFVRTTARSTPCWSMRPAPPPAPSGAIVYCVCSLEPEEGEQQIEALLAREPNVCRKPVGPGEIPGTAGFLNPDGDLRTLPSQWPDSDPRMSGLDGFFAARLQRI
jgi:16S rRNA (cytosine967-C5)-methyltransferase